jgi:hypothetical protein
MGHRKGYSSSRLYEDQLKNADPGISIAQSCEAREAREASERGSKQKTKKQTSEQTIRIKGGKQGQNKRMWRRGI